MSVYEALVERWQEKTEHGGKTVSKFTTNFVQTGLSSNPVLSGKAGEWRIIKCSNRGVCVV